MSPFNAALNSLSDKPSTAIDFSMPLSGTQAHTVSGAREWPLTGHTANSSLASGKTKEEKLIEGLGVVHSILEIPGFARAGGRWLGGRGGRKHHMLQLV